ncbi:MAG: hypothetical protein WD009_13900 [Phycisphaeraceae bacterium]
MMYPPATATTPATTPVNIPVNIPVTRRAPAPAGARAMVAAMLFAMMPAMSFADVPEPLVPIESVEIGANRELIVNGEPFLPIMSWAQKPSRFSEIRALGFNTFTGQQRNVNPLEQAEAAQAAGGYAVAGFGGSGEEAVGHAYLLAWIQGDEPDMPQRAGQAGTPDDIEGGEPRRRFEPKRTPAQTLEQYQAIQAADGSRPVFVTFTGHFSRTIRSHYSAAEQAELYPAYARAADVLGFDIYPIYGHGRPGWLNRPAEAVEQLVEMGDGEKPVYAWIETSKGSRWMTYERQPDVLPVHTRFQVWGAIIRGATAIGYFTHAWAPSFSEFAATDAMREELARINGQLTRLAPAILAPPSERQIELRLSGGLAGHFKATEHDDELYIFAQNIDLGENADQLGQFEPISPRAATGTLIVEGLEAGTTIEVVDEGRTITTEQGEFRDDFDALAEHIYRIPLR